MLFWYKYLLESVALNLKPLRPNQNLIQINPSMMLLAQPSRPTARITRHSKFCGVAHLLTTHPLSSTAKTMLFLHQRAGRESDQQHRTRHTPHACHEPPSSYSFQEPVAQTTQNRGNRRLRTRLNSRLNKAAQLGRYQL